MKKVETDQQYKIFVISGNGSKIWGNGPKILGNWSTN